MPVPPLGHGAMAWMARAASRALVHLNLLLFLYAGAALATAARLKWDPSTYIALRELLPFEYRVLAVSMCAGGATLLLLGHLCAAALASNGARTRRVLLLMYAVSMALLLAAELACGVWLVTRVVDFLSSERARLLAETTPVLGKLKEFLAYFSAWFGKIKLLIEEAEQDVPRNVYVLAASVGLLAVLQPLAIVLALLAARTPIARVRRSRSWGTATTTAAASVDQLVDNCNENAPLRTAYRNGRIVIL